MTTRVLRRHEVVPVAKPGQVPVTCWCEDRIVLVTERDVFEGRTRTCGRPACHAPQRPEQGR